MKRAVFSFLVLSISFLAFGFFLRVPSANAACTSSPTILYDSNDYTGGVRSVVYHIRVKNNCAGAQDVRIRVSSLPNVSQNSGDFVPNRNIQDRLNANWKINNNAWDEPLVINIAGNSTRNVDVTVRRDIEYYHPDGNYGYVKIRAALVSNTSYNDTRSVIYVVQNRPDLTVTRFEFPGGPTCETTNAIVRIRNIGWKSFSGDFDVRVFNGNGNNGRTFRVTQFVDAREFINLDSRFRNMNRPPVGEWVARAVVDLNNEILEENEKDNEEKFKYETTPCITPTPTTPPATPTTPPITPTPTPIPATGDYYIKGGVYIDEDLSKTKNNEESYISGNIQIRNTSSGNLVDSPSSIANTGFTSIQLPAARYSITYTPPVGVKVTYPSISPYTITMNLGPTCIDDIPGDPTCDSLGNIINVNFGIEPAVVYAEPWIQGVGGDMRVDHGMQNIIPDTSSYFSEIFSSTFAMDHGVVFGNSSLKLGDTLAEKANTSSWLANVAYNPATVTTSYFIMGGILDKGGVLENARSIFTTACTSVSSSPNCTLNDTLESGTYTSLNVTTTNLSSSANTFQTGRNYIFLIKNNLVIKSNIIVPKGSTVLFIVGGNITVDDDVTILEGVYSTDGFFTVENCGCAGEDKQLTIGGSVIANASKAKNETTFINKRDLGSANDTTPAIKFIYRPDFVLNMPQLIRYKSYSIREVAPGSRIN